ncbi:hypothetical protein LZ578_11835 [Jeotgalibaca sp. MA1X17-3]|uniref:hypothetical protein n=1 Tax=Jeotgalibaca sp. MA1X17-3 TaxID=2908211 RepID=UPI001F1DBE46|nr:hypothetical protein [Jeotgalibaca sp. MA1X17-3]UJF15627.1 hypothetical protein LZ578_11835 [Jeotgalibaca sp. MA1X17-3]
MLTDKETLEMVVLSSLDKVFDEGPSDGNQISEGMALIDEKFSFQVAFKGSEKLNFKIESNTLTEVNIFKVGQVMSHLPVNEGHDEDILKGIPGLFPDVLYPVTLPTEVNGTAGQWHSFWIEISADSELVGNHEVDLIVEGLPAKKLKRYLH